MTTAADSRLLEEFFIIEDQRNYGKNKKTREGSGGGMEGQPSMFRGSISSKGNDAKLDVGKRESGCSNGAASLTHKRLVFPREEYQE